MIKTLILTALVVSVCVGTNHVLHRNTDSIFDAIEAEDLVGLRSLLDRGTRPDLRDEGGRTLLLLAVRRNSPETVALLLDRGSDPNAADSMGYTPLHYGAMVADVSVLRLLAEHGADLNRHTQMGLTPLHLAAERLGGDSIFNWLLRHGADPHICDRSDCTPFDLLKERQDAEARLQTSCRPR
jgi:ankyrin repeat protein